jgi:hypothetical protein
VEGNDTLSRLLAVIAFLLSLVPAASAQDTSPYQALPRLDVTGVTGWLSHHVPDEGLDSDSWNNRWYGGAQFGHYWTEHLKTEMEIGLTNEGESWAVYPAYVSPRPGEVRFINEARRSQDVTVSLGQRWQFFSNQWVHPFVGGGIDANHARIRREFHSFAPGVGPPQITRLADGGWHAAIHGVAGVKVYFTARSFVRFDGRVASGQDGQHVVFRVGLGRDF